MQNGVGLAAIFEHILRFKSVFFSFLLEIQAFQRSEVRHQSGKISNQSVEIYFN